MSDRSHPLRPEDYLEPVCPLCVERSDVQPIPQQRVARKLDEYMSRRDYEGAERHLLYWLEGAKRGRDRRGELFLCNELTGHYRKTANRDAALPCIDRALRLLDELGHTEGITAGTTLVNAATALSAFGENERALALFERARALCEADETPPRLLGGLYNNMAAACAALGRHCEAFSLYELALEQMSRVRGSAPEQAVTCLNMADAAAAELGMEAGEARVAALLERAAALLSDESVPRDGYYAFVCEKCAPGFDHYGWFAAARDCREAARAIYERA